MIHHQILEVPYAQTNPRISAKPWLFGTGAENIAADIREQKKAPVTARP